ncbi:hypothetical protein [Escherichia phage vB_EcoM_PD205]|nr:hypothetical protein [Escherichia phage vB_EcoM_PD205]
MKKLALYAMLTSALLTLIFAYKVAFTLETDMQFFQASILFFVSEVGLWCIYYIARDYEAIREQEEVKKQMIRFVEQNRK